MFNNKRAFTLAEVMVVFTVIGILTAILVPTIFSASPDQDKLKAKKAFNTLTRTVENLTNGVYALNDGILDATVMVRNVPADPNLAQIRNRYFAQNFVELLNVKESNLDTDLVNDKVTMGRSTDATCGEGTNALCIQRQDEGENLNYAAIQNAFDNVCSAVTTAENFAGNYNMVTADGISWLFQMTDFSRNDTVTVNGVDSPSFYNVVCFVTDANNAANTTFGAGVRKDGKVLVGTRLQEILDEDHSRVIEE